MMKKSIFFIFIITLLSIRCTENDILASNGTLDASFTNLPNLGSGFAYQAWLLVNGTYVSVGTFTVDDIGTASKTSFTGINNNDLENATAMALTVESTSGKSSPSDVIIMAGNFSDGTATLIPDDSRTVFASDIQAQYVIDIPSATTAEIAGVPCGLWFSTTKATITNTPGLILPYNQNVSAKTPFNINYQSWVQTIDNKGNTTYINMGVFTSATAKDNANNYGGSITSYVPIYPGNDFVAVTGIDVTNPFNLINSNNKLIIKMIPSDVSSPSSSTPTGITLFEDNITANAGSLSVIKPYTATFIKK